jgi:hypothetical protein
VAGFGKGFCYNLPTKLRQLPYFLLLICANYPTFFYRFAPITLLFFPLL